MQSCAVIYKKLLFIFVCMQKGLAIIIFFLFGGMCLFESCCCCSACADGYDTHPASYEVKHLLQLADTSQRISEVHYKNSDIRITPTGSWADVPLSDEGVTVLYIRSTLGEDTLIVQTGTRFEYVDEQNECSGTDVHGYSRVILEPMIRFHTFDSAAVERRIANKNPGWPGPGVTTHLYYLYDNIILK